MLKVSQIHTHPLSHMKTKLSRTKLSGPGLRGTTIFARSRPRPVLVPSESEKLVFILASPRDQLGRGRS